MKHIQQFSTIGRAVDPRYPTNLAISIYAVIVLIVMFVFQLVTGQNFLNAGWQALLASVSVFFAWAFAREIDPEEQLSAFVAAGLMSIAVFVVGTPFNLIVLFYLMSMARVVVRTVGLPATLFDSIVLIIFTGIVGLLWSWIYALLGAIAFLLDAVLPEPNRRHLIFAGLATIIAIVGFVLQADNQTASLPTMPYLVGIIGATIIFIPLILRSKALTVRCDATDEIVMSIRLQATQIMTLVFGFIVAFWHGNQGIIEFLPLWLTVAGVALFPVIKPFLPDWNLDKMNKPKQG